LSTGTYYIIYLYCMQLLSWYQVAQHHDLIVSIPKIELTYKMNRIVEFYRLSQRDVHHYIVSTSRILFWSVTYWLAYYSMGSNTSKSCRFTNPPRLRTIMHKFTNITVCHKNVLYNEENYFCYCRTIEKCKKQCVWAFK